MPVQMRAEPRRRAILEAALECFSSAGYDAASIEQICRVSGSSVGSVYHHFGSKEGIAAALYEEGIASYQEGMLEVLADAGPVAATVDRVVRHHLGWVLDHPDWARFLLQMGTTPATAAARPAVRRRNDELLSRLGEWAHPRVAAHRLVDVSPMALLALILGPCHALARAWLAGEADLDEATLDLVGDAVARAVQPE